MKYVIIGAGGTGGSIGGFLSKAGKDVTLIARGEHLNQMQQSGLHFETVEGRFSVPVKACTAVNYSDTPDIIFVCVKGYSLDETYTFLQKIASPGTIIIPILNIYGTGMRLQERLPDIPVTDGCIYIAAEIKKPGTILMSGKIFRVVYGLRRNTPPALCTFVLPKLKAVEKDLADAGITPLLSSFVERDTLQKFSFVSPMAALGACYDVSAAEIQKKGKLRDTFIGLNQEIGALSDAMGISLPKNIAEINLEIMDHLVPTATASMHRDIRNGRQSEIDGLVYQVVRLGRDYQVSMPAYETIAHNLACMLAVSRNDEE